MPHPARELLGKLFTTRLGTNILSLYAVQGLNYLLPLLVLPYLLRVLGPGGYGSVAFAQSLLSYAVMLTDYGFNFSATRAISLARDNPAELARIFWSTLAAKLLLLLISALVLVPVVALVPQFRAQWQVFAVCGLAVVGSCAFPQWYFQGLERMRAVAIIQAVTKLIAFVATFVFVRSGTDQVVAAAILSMPMVIAALLCAVVIKSIAPVRSWRPNVRDVRAAFAGNWHLFVSIAAGTLYLNTNSFLLGLMSGTYAVALYTLANKVALTVFNLFGPIFQATFPRASVAFGQSGPEARRFVRRLAVLLLPAAALVSLLLMVCAPLIIRVAAGGAYAGAIPVLRIMAVLPLLLTAGALLSQTVMINAGLSRALSRVYMTVGILNLVILPVLIIAYDAPGAAASLVVAELLGPILMFIVIRRRRVFSVAAQRAGRAIERSEICAVVVTYFPKPGCTDNLAAILPQVGKLLVVDNGSNAESFAAVEDAAQRLGFTMVRLGANLGIATALNVGLKFARDNGFRWLATFDQDSQATPGMIEAMAGALAAFPRPETVAIVTPCHVDRLLGVRVRERGSEDSGAGWRVIPSTMTSGNLVAVEVALGAGGFDDSLFIDYVDHEFCLRLRRHGYRVLEALHATLLHSLGNMERRWFVFKHVSITNHPVVRRYYSSRNRLIVWRGYWRHAPAWVIRDIRRFVFETLYIGLYEQQARAKFAAIVRGLRDGSRNVRGEFRPASR